MVEYGLPCLNFVPKQKWLSGPIFYLLRSTSGILGLLYVRQVCDPRDCLHYYPETDANTQPRHGHRPCRFGIHCHFPSHCGSSAILMASCKTRRSHVFYHSFIHIIWILIYLYLEQENTGLVAIAAFLGYLCAAVPFSTLPDRIAARLTRRNSNIREAEFRIWCLVPVVFVSPAGLILYGYTAEKQLHWVGFLVAVGIFQFGELPSYVLIFF